MEFKQGTSNIILSIKPRQNGVVINMVTWTTQYGELNPADGVYTLVAETADKSDTLEIPSTEVNVADITFVLPDSMFAIAQRTWTVSLKFLIQEITDFSLYNFDIKVTKPESVNTR